MSLFTLYFSSTAVFLALFYIFGQVWELITVSQLTALPEAADQEASQQAGETEAGSIARICKITEPHCQSFVSVFVIQCLKRSLCVWLGSHGMLTRPWTCLPDIIRLDKRRDRQTSIVPLRATLPYVRKPEARKMLTPGSQLLRKERKKPSVEQFGVQSVPRNTNI